MAVDNIGQALVFNGATWFLDTSAIFPDSSALPAQVSCKSASFCMVVRGGYAVSWDGRAFSAPVNVVAPVYDFTSVSCPAQGSCVAVSNNAVGYYSSGQWTTTEGVNHGSYLSCPTMGLCISVGLPADAWTYRNGAWSGPVDLGSKTFGPAELSCPPGTSARQSAVTARATAWQRVTRSRRRLGGVPVACPIGQSATVFQGHSR